MQIFNCRLCKTYVKGLGFTEISNWPVHFLDCWTVLPSLSALSSIADSGFYRISFETFIHLILLMLFMSLLYCVPFVVPMQLLSSVRIYCSFVCCLLLEFVWKMLFIHKALVLLMLLIRLCFLIKYFNAHWCNLLQPMNANYRTNTSRDLMNSLVANPLLIYTVWFTPLIALCTNLEKVKFWLSY